MQTISKVYQRLNACAHDYNENSVEMNGWPYHIFYGRVGAYSFDVNSAVPMDVDDVELVGTNADAVPMDVDVCEGGGADVGPVDMEVDDDASVGNVDASVAMDVSDDTSVGTVDTSVDMEVDDDTNVGTVNADNAIETKINELRSLMGPPSSSETYKSEAVTTLVVKQEKHVNQVLYGERSEKNNGKSNKK